MKSETPCFNACGNKNAGTKGQSLVSAAGRLGPNTIKDLFRKGKLEIAVVGCGWMGLPTACLFAEKGAKVFGIDINPEIVKTVNNGKCPFDEPGLPELLERNVSRGRLSCTTDFAAAVPKSDAVIVVVPTGVDRKKRSDYSSLIKACRDVGEVLTRGEIVIVESTIAPSQLTVIKHTLERYSDLKAGEEFGLAYSPVRASAGTVLRDLVNYPKVIGGYDQCSLDTAETLFSIVVKGGIIKASNMVTAAAAKLFENIYRDVNIALANQLACYCEKSGIDFHEVRQISNTIPTHCQLREVGAGVGGHCIPVNPYFLLNEAAELGLDLSIIKVSRRINDAMPGHVVSLIKEGLAVNGKNLAGSKIVLFGAAFKGNVPELRFSPSSEIQRILADSGSNVLTYDPLCSFEELLALGYQAAEKVEVALDGADCLVIAVRHSAFLKINYEQLVKRMRNRLLVDCCGIIRPQDADKWGVLLKALGRGST